MITVELTNKGAPFVAEDGTPAGGVVIQLQLVDENGNPADDLDTETHEHILPLPITLVSLSVATTELAVGEFSVRLWPTDRGQRNLKYSYKVMGYPATRAGAQPITSGTDPLSWYDFINGITIPTDARTDSTGEVVTDSEGNIITDSGESL